MEETTQPEFLVVGTTVLETVTHQPHGGKRTGLGGVAATMAVALAEAGNQVTLLTTIGQGAAAQEIRRLLAQAPLDARVLNRRHAAGQTAITTRNGQHHSAKGRWPTVSKIAKAAEKLSKPRQTVLLDCNMTDTDLFTILQGTHQDRIVNGTTPRSSLHMLSNQYPPGTIITLNGPETKALATNANVRSATELLFATKAAAALLTKGKKGWEYHQPHIARLTSEAVPVPEHTDFIGCGDYATAGLAHAITHGTDITGTINDFVSRKLKANVVTPPAEQRNR